MNYRTVFDMYPKCDLPRPKILDDEVRSLIRSEKADLQTLELILRILDSVRTRIEHDARLLEEESTLAKDRLPRIEVNGIFELTCMMAELAHDTWPLRQRVEFLKSMTQIVAGLENQQQ